MAPRGCLGHNMICQVKETTHPPRPTSPDLQYLQPMSELTCYAQASSGKGEVGHLERMDWSSAGRDQTVPRAKATALAALRFQRRQGSKAWSGKEGKGIKTRHLAAFLPLPPLEQEPFVHSKPDQSLILSHPTRSVRPRQHTMSSSHYAPGVSQGLVPVTCNMCSFDSIRRYAPNSLHTWTEFLDK